MTAKDIIRKAEEKVRGTETAYSEMKIIVKRPKWSREMTMKSWLKGNDYSLILITSPVKEKGTAFLKRKQEIWNWVPSIERTIKLPPSMMGQSWMGTDLTNDDLVKESSNVTDYTHTLLEDTVINGRECYQIELIPKPDASVVWGKVMAYITKKDLVQVLTKMYDEDEFLVSITKASDIKQMGGVVMATRMEMIPTDKDGHATIMIIENMEFNKPIADNFFTLQNIKKVQ